MTGRQRGVWFGERGLTSVCIAVLEYADVSVYFFDFLNFFDLGPILRFFGSWPGVVLIPIFLTTCTRMYSSIFMRAQLLVRQMRPVFLQWSLSVQSSWLSFIDSQSNASASAWLEKGGNPSAAIVATRASYLVRNDLKQGLRPVLSSCALEEDVARVDVAGGGSQHRLSVCSKGVDRGLTGA